jgi:hypothetical protein
MASDKKAPETYTAPHQAAPRTPTSGGRYVRDADGALRRAPAPRPLADEAVTPTHQE